MKKHYRGSDCVTRWLNSGVRANQIVCDCTDTVGASAMCLAHAAMSIGKVFKPYLKFVLMFNDRLCIDPLKLFGTVAMQNSHMLS